jgi:hypothetical protein
MYFRLFNDLTDQSTSTYIRILHIFLFFNIPKPVFEHSWFPVQYNLYHSLQFIDKFYIYDIIICLYSSFF